MSTALAELPLSGATADATVAPDPLCCGSVAMPEGGVQLRAGCGGLARVWHRRR